jgi:hypothetical protein
MLYTIDTDTGYIDNDNLYDQQIFHTTIEFIIKWADKMERKDPQKYKFDILRSIHQYYEKKGYVSQKQYELLRKFWLKWRIYKTWSFYDEIEDEEVRINDWVEDTFEYYNDVEFGFPSREIQVGYIFRKKAIKTT